ncbi:MAG: T9SS type A sorting domain-containing protein, partial [Ignavibacteria bacterium]
QPYSNEAPNQFSLSQNYPNPFNPTTNIKFAIPNSEFVKLIVYDIPGREVEMLVNENLNAGTYNADWNAASFSSGVYFYKLHAGEFTETKKMVLVK